MSRSTEPDRHAIPNRCGPRGSRRCLMKENAWPKKLNEGPPRAPRPARCRAGSTPPRGPRSPPPHRCRGDERPTAGRKKLSAKITSCPTRNVASRRAARCARRSWSSEISEPAMNSSPTIPTLTEAHPIPLSGISAKSEIVSAFVNAVSAAAARSWWIGSAFSEVSRSWATEIATKSRPISAPATPAVATKKSRRDSGTTAASCQVPGHRRSHQPSRLARPRLSRWQRRCGKQEVPLCRTFEHGASRTRTGDLLGAMHRRGEMTGTAGLRIARIYGRFGFGADRGWCASRVRMYPFGTRA